ncbi:MAG: hypothetical protein ACRDQA_01955 [Nocardioidaceae bacterium]
MTNEQREAREQLIDYLNNEIAVDWLIDHVETVARAAGARVRTERYGAAQHKMHFTDLAGDTHLAWCDCPTGHDHQEVEP